MVILHEIAHLVTPKKFAGHGREFCRNYLLLVGRFLGKDAARDLRRLYVQHKVRYRPNVERPDLKGKRPPVKAARQSAA